MRDLAKLYGSNIKRLREKQGLTQDELAARLGVKQSYLSNVESGRKGISPKRAQEIAGIMGVDASEMLFDPSAEPQPTFEELSVQIRAAIEKAMGELISGKTPLPERPLPTSMPEHIREALESYAGPWEPFERILGISPESQRSRKTRQK